MSKKVLSAVICKPIVKGQQCFQMLEPLAGVVDQDATPHVGAWLLVQPGSFLQLTLTVSAIKGTLLVHLETARHLKATPRIIGVFQARHVPAKVDVMAVSDALVRVVATPGRGQGQAATWRVSGKGFVPYAPAT